MSVFGVLLFRIFPHSVRMREIKDQENSGYGHFSRSVILRDCPISRYTIHHDPTIHDPKMHDSFIIVMPSFTCYEQTYVSYRKIKRFHWIIWIRSDSFPLRQKIDKIKHNFFMSFLHVMFPRSKKQKKLNEISSHQCTYCFATTAILFV